MMVLKVLLMASTAPSLRHMRGAGQSRSSVASQAQTVWRMEVHER